jgi:hypothetical protein
MQNQYARLLASFVVGVLVGVGGYWLTVRDSSGIKSTQGAEAAEEETDSTVISSSLTVNDQKPGSTVEISSLKLVDPSWIAIRDDISGNPGPKVLGARYFATGADNGTVELLRNTVEGKSYFAIIYKDNGDGKFDSKTDPVVADENGTTITVKFTATAATQDTQ